MFYFLLTQFIQDSQLDNKQVRCEESETSKRLIKSHQLVFIPGQTNPLLFLSNFEKCSDLKNEQDKMFGIRNIVDESDRGKDTISYFISFYFIDCFVVLVEFSNLYFTSDWQSVRRTFLKKYSLKFIKNKKDELKIDFNEETSLRSFVERKLTSLSLYTTLPLINQMEIVLTDLPDEVASLFLVNEKMNSKKAEILEFCDSIQDLVQTMQSTTENETDNVQSAEDLSTGNRMEIFNFDTESKKTGAARGSSTARGSGTARGTKRKRPSTNTISYGNQIDDGSQSSFSDMLVDQSSEAPQSKEIVKRGRGRPRKSFLHTIPETCNSSPNEYLNEITDSSDASRQ